MSKGTIADVISGQAAWALHEGDTLELALPPECADAWIQDPPAGINFMNKAFDSDRGGMDQWIAWAARLFNVAFDALKPGAYGAVWALPRTADWTMQALRRAGFEIFDSLSHVFASGFPKSLSIEKAIAVRGEDGSRFAGYGTALKPAHECWVLVRKPLVGTYASNILANGTGGINVDAGRVGASKDVPASPGGKQTGVYGARSGDDGTSVGYDPGVGRWPANLVFSHASWDESACASCGLTMPFAARFCPGCGGPVEVERAGCRCVGKRQVRSGTTYEPSDGRPNPRSVANAPGEYLGRVTGYADESGRETVDAWECLATCDRCGASALVASGGDAGPCAGCGALRRWACPVARLDEQSGNRSSGAMAAGTMRPAGNMVYGAIGGQATVAEIEASAGGASRFFHCFPPDPTEPFWYSAKPSTAEREAGLDGLPKGAARGSMNTKNGAGERFDGAPTATRANDHPTVKGFHLIGHLCDLFVPPGGLVLDLTAGSGTLGAVVAHRHHVTGWRAIMGEMDPGYCSIIRARCKHWGARPWKPRAKAAAKPKANGCAQGSLFERPR